MEFSDFYTPFNEALTVADMDRILNERYAWVDSEFPAKYDKQVPSQKRLREIFKNQFKSAYDSILPEVQKIEKDQADSAKRAKDSEERAAELQSRADQLARQNADGRREELVSSRSLDSSQRMLTGRNRGDGQTMLTRGYQRRTLMGG